MKSWALLFILLVAFALTGCHRNLFTGMYSATAEMQVQSRGVMDQVGFVSTTTGPATATEIAEEINIIQSPDILTPIIKDQKLDQIWAKRFKSGYATLSPQEALDHLLKVLKIEGIAGTSIIKVTAYSEVPQEAVAIANAIVDRYKALRDQEVAMRNDRGIDSLRDQIAQQQKVLEDKTTTLAKMPQDAKSQRDLTQQQSLLIALNARLRQCLDDVKLMQSPVRIISRAVAAP